VNYFSVACVYRSTASRWWWRTLHSCMSSDISLSVKWANWSLSSMNRHRVIRPLPSHSQNSKY